MDIPPISTLTIASLQTYDDSMQTKADAELAANDLSKYEFDEDVLHGNEVQIALREGLIDEQTAQSLQAYYSNQEQGLLAQNPTNGSDC